MTQARWYVAVLVVRSWIGDTLTGDPLIDLQYRLIRAESPENAHARALELGRAADRSYQNSKGQLVSWGCIGLHDLREVAEAELSDGIQIYGELVRSDPGGYVVPKERLSAFSDAEKEKAARALFDGI